MKIKADRQTQSVAEAIELDAIEVATRKYEELRKDSAATYAMSEALAVYKRMTAQAAIAASDARFVPELVNALQVALHAVEWLADFEEAEEGQDLISDVAIREVKKVLAKLPKEYQQ